MPETRTYWLSFCDPDRPTGAQFLGACVVDVTNADRLAVRAEVRAQFPQARPGAEWIAAAGRKAWALGCNPGGEMLCVELTDRWYAPPAGTSRRLALTDLPRHQLLTSAELQIFGAPYA